MLSRSQRQITFKRKACTAYTAQLAGAVVAAPICVVALLGYDRLMTTAIAAISLCAGCAVSAGLLATERGSMSLRKDPDRLESVQFSGCIDSQAQAGLAAVALAVSSLLVPALSWLLPAAALMSGVAVICAARVLVRISHPRSGLTEHCMVSNLPMTAATVVATAQTSTGFCAVGLAAAGLIWSAHLALSAAAVFALVLITLLSAASALVQLIDTSRVALPRRVDRAHRGV
jgi:hypothetical protein